MTQPRTYTAIIQSISGIGTLPFFQIATPSATAIELIRLEFGVEDSTTNQQECIQLMQRTTNSTLPNVTQRTPLLSGDPITMLASTSITNAYGVATGTGSYGASIMRWCFNCLNGLVYAPVPEERPILAPSKFWTLEFAASPAANTWDGYVMYHELT